MEFNKNILTVNNIALEFNDRINEVIEFADCYIVLTDYFQSTTNQNVYGVDKKGKKIWQIDNLESLTYKDKEYIGITHPYSELEKIDTNIVKLINWDGTSFNIEPNTGKILSNPISSRIGK